MNPKMNLSALLIVLLFSLGLVSSAPLAISTGNTCCPSTQKAKIPLKQIVSYYNTSSSCALPALVFVTKLGKHWCVNPADGWVKSHAAAVDRRLASTPAMSTRA
ncbi:C-C motif chemokine 3-like 1 [Conger conger]|uniref:C-C motif chemokine 3-like 1 n=1 Tax=Conger conger TaxID=82655 RepID=UPI002A59DC3D|nr:C-C motif chemokine 3-like 1 [Conger conger]